MLARCEEARLSHEEAHRSLCRLMRRLIKAVADKLSIPHAEEIIQAVKLKFLLAGTLPELQEWPVKFRDFEVEHDYLPCYENGPQARIRRRGRQVSVMW